MLSWLDKELGDSILVSLMGQYLPLNDLENYPEINRKITKREYDKVLDFLSELNLDGFAQELDSAKESYIPEFNIDKL